MTSPQAIPDALPAADSPLQESHYALIRQAMTARRAITRAAATARFSAISTLIIGLASVPFVVLGNSWQGCLAATAITLIGAIEHIGYQRLRRADASACALLGRNQLAFLTLIIIYCIVQMVTFSSAQLKGSLVSPELSGVMDTRALEQQINALAPLVVYGLYSLVILLSIAMQGGLALYYFTRKRHVDAFNRTTPPWIKRLLLEVQG